jgi:hypothetical protein
MMSQNGGSEARIARSSRDQRSFLSMGKGGVMTDEWAPASGAASPPASPGGAPSPPGPVVAPPPATPVVAPHALLGPGLVSVQARFVSSGIATRMRVDVHDGWLAVTGVMLPRRWRMSVQIALFVTAFVIAFALIVVRPLWSPQLFAVVTAALFAFLVIMVAAGRPSRVVTLLVPLSQVSLVAPEATVESLGGKRRTVILRGPFGGDWSTNGMIKLTFANEADALSLIAALRSGIVRYETPPMR